MLYYLGVMQVIIRRIAIIMQVLMGTTAGESLNAAGNIFIGQVRLNSKYFEMQEFVYYPAMSCFSLPLRIFRN